MGERTTNIFTMAKVYSSPFCNLVIPRHRSSITADHVLTQVVNLNATFMQVVFYLMPIGRLAQVFQLGLLSLAITIDYGQVPPDGQALAGRVPLAYNGNMIDYSQYISLSLWGFSGMGRKRIINLW